MPGITAEASLLPLGIVLVLLYNPAHPLGFVLVSLTYLLIDLVFSRLSRTRKQLEARVQELEILNATARRLSASLQLEELVAAQDSHARSGIFRDCSTCIDQVVRPHVLSRCVDQITREKNTFRDSICLSLVSMLRPHQCGGGTLRRLVLRKGV